MGSLDFSANLEVPWTMGVFEVDWNNPGDWIFLRTGMLISPFLVFIAGHLNFSRPFNEYAVATGISSARDLKKQINNLQTIVARVSFIQYDFDFRGPDNFSWAILHMDQELGQNSSRFKPIETKSYQIVASSPQTRFVSTIFLSAYNPNYEMTVSGFSSEDDRKLTYYRIKWIGNDTVVHNAKGELASSRDPCISYGNLFSVKIDFLKFIPNVVMVGAAQSGVVPTDSLYPEQDLIFDEDFCPGNVAPDFGDVLSQQMEFFGGALNCSRQTFACDHTCHTLDILANGVPDCKNGADENPVYLTHREEFLKFAKNATESLPKPNNKLVIILSSVFGSVVVLLVMITLALIQHTKMKYKKLNQSEIDEFFKGRQHTSSNPTTKDTKQDQNSDGNDYQNMPYNKKDEINPKRLRIYEDKRLGSGAYGDVYKGEIADRNGRREVAIKTIKGAADISYIRAMLIEIKIFQHLGQHQNIIGFYGAITKNISRGEVSIVLEYANLGSLLDFLLSYEQNYQNCPREVIRAKTFLRWSIEIACGMSHLELKRVIHADLAARNILIASDRTLKITDFGLSRKLYDYDSYSKQNKAPLPWRHMALESLQNLKFSSKSDVWGYGVTLWEIFSMCQTPFAGMSWSTEFISDLEDGLRLGKPKNCPDSIYNLMIMCWHNEPEIRPSFEEIAEEVLRQLHEDF